MLNCWISAIIPLLHYTHFHTQYVKTMACNSRRVRIAMIAESIEVVWVRN